jgi:hypothetical protein
MPDIVSAALRIRRAQQDGEREAAGEIWQQMNGMPSLIFTGRYGIPIDLAGRTAAEVGEQYGLAKSSVLELVRQAGKSVRHSRLSAHETAQLVALYKAGLPQKDIAKRLGRTPSAVWHCLRRRAGLVGAGQNDRPPDSLIET